MPWQHEFRNLTNEISKMHKDRSKYILRMKTDVRQMKKDWNAERAQMETDLLNNFDAWDKARVKEVASMRSATQTLLSELDAQHKKRSKDLDEFLKSKVEELRSATQNLLTGLNEDDKARVKEVADLKNAVQTFLANFRDEDIARFREENKDRADAIAQFKVEVGTLIGEFRREREEAATAWKDLIGKIAVPRVEKEQIKPKPKKKPAEEGEEEVKKEEEFRELTGKEKRILSIINDHPEGITLPEIAYIMSVAFVTITRDVKRLLTDGMIKKKENKYYPV